MSQPVRIDYFREAFGSFDPDRDWGAALIMADGKLEYLASLLALDTRVGAIGGDPGWELERRNPTPPVATAYASWPEWAAFRAYVDPEGFRLEHPESFHDARTSRDVCGLRQRCTVGTIPAGCQLLPPCSTSFPSRPSLMAQRRFNKQSAQP